MTVPALEIAPAPLYPELGSHVFGVTYQDAMVQLQLYSDGYAVTLDRPKRLILRPPDGYTSMDLNGDGAFVESRDLVAQPGVQYVVRGNR
jgi:hypothetical protein